MHVYHILCAKIPSVIKLYLSENIQMKTYNKSICSIKGLKRSARYLGKRSNQANLVCSCRRLALGLKIAHYPLVDNIKILHVFLVGKKVHKKINRLSEYPSKYKYNKSTEISKFLITLLELSK